ncbi:hypothetical protein B0H13DRAFT_1878186 [Mycena leptocephala]|nr:hypothetical protein B0H13DRAFT_1878186 [Mycena leptocephala]
MCGIFGLSGFVFTIFLAFRIGDDKAQCLKRFIGVWSFWNVAIILLLLLTWMAWYFQLPVYKLLFPRLRAKLLQIIPSLFSAHLEIKLLRNEYLRELEVFWYKKTGSILLMIGPSDCVRETSVHVWLVKLGI